MRKKRAFKPQARIQKMHRQDDRKRNYKTVKIGMGITYSPGQKENCRVALMYRLQSLKQRNREGSYPLPIIEFVYRLNNAAVFTMKDAALFLGIYSRKRHTKQHL